MAHQRFTIPASAVAVLGNTAARRAVSLEWTASNQFNAGLSGGAVRYLRQLRLDAPHSDGAYRIFLAVGATSTEPPAAGQDLTAQFEGNWEIGITVGTETWILRHDDFSVDTEEVYVWRPVLSVSRRDMRAAVLALIGGSGNVTVTLWDGQGQDPFAPVTEFEAAAAPTGLTAAADLASLAPPPTELQAAAEEADAGFDADLAVFEIVPLEAAATATALEADSDLSSGRPPSNIQRMVLPAPVGFDAGVTIDWIITAATVPNEADRGQYEIDPLLLEGGVAGQYWRRIRMFGPDTNFRLLAAPSFGAGGGATSEDFTDRFDFNWHLRWTAPTGESFELAREDFAPAIDSAEPFIYAVPQALRERITRELLIPAFNAPGVKFAVADGRFGVAAEAAAAPTGLGIDADLASATPTRLEAAAAATSLTSTADLVSATPTRLEADAAAASLTSTAFLATESPPPTEFTAGAAGTALADDAELDSVRPPPTELEAGAAAASLKSSAALSAVRPTLIEAAALATRLDSAASLLSDAPRDTELKAAADATGILTRVALDAERTTHQTFLIPLASRRVTISANARSLVLTSNERIIAGLSGGAVRYLRELRLDAPHSSGVYRIFLSVGATPTEPPKQGQDLTAQFEGNWEIGITVGTETWILRHDDFPVDTEEVYVWQSFRSVPRRDMTAAVAAAAADTGDVAITLWDGQGLDPFGDIPVRGSISMEADAAPTSLSAAADLSVEAPGEIALRAAAAATALLDDAELAVLAPPTELEAAAATTALTAAADLSSRLPPVNLQSMALPAPTAFSEGSLIDWSLNEASVPGVPDRAQYQVAAEFLNGPAGPFYRRLRLRGANDDFLLNASAAFGTGGGVTSEDFTDRFEFNFHLRWTAPTGESVVIARAELAGQDDAEPYIFTLPGVLEARLARELFIPAFNVPGVRLDIADGPFIAGTGLAADAAPSGLSIDADLSAEAPEDIALTAGAAAAGLSIDASLSATAPRATVLEAAAAPSGLTIGGTLSSARRGGFDLIAAALRTGLGIEADLSAVGPADTAFEAAAARSGLSIDADLGVREVERTDLSARAGPVSLAISASLLAEAFTADRPELPVIEPKRVPVASRFIALPRMANRQYLVSLVRSNPLLDADGAEAVPPVGSVNLGFTVPQQGGRGISGTAGTSHKEVSVYQAVGLDAELPDAPDGATPTNFAESSLSGLGDWTVAFPDYDATTQKVACTSATIGSNLTITPWSSVRVCDSPGDLNTVYRRSLTEPAALPDGPMRVPAGTADTVAGTAGDLRLWANTGHRNALGTIWSWDGWVGVEGTEARQRDLTLRVDDKTGVSVSVSTPKPKETPASYELRLSERGSANALQTRSGAGGSGGFEAEFTGLTPNTRYRIEGRALYEGDESGPVDILRPVTTVEAGSRVIATGTDRFKAEVPRAEGMNPAYEWRYDIGLVTGSIGDLVWVSAGSTNVNRTEIVLASPYDDGNRAIQVQCRVMSGPANARQAGGWFVAGYARAWQKDDAPENVRSIRLSFNAAGQAVVRFLNPLSTVHPVVRYGVRLWRDGVLADRLGFGVTDQDIPPFELTGKVQTTPGRFIAVVVPISEDASGEEYRGDEAASNVIDLDDVPDAVIIDNTPFTIA